MPALSLRGQEADLAWLWLRLSRAWAHSSLDKHEQIKRQFCGHLVPQLAEKVGACSPCECLLNRGGSALPGSLKDLLGTNASEPQTLTLRVSPLLHHWLLASGLCHSWVPGRWALEVRLG